MQDRFFGSIREDMDVEDADGDKIGTIDEIFRPAAVTSTTATTGQAVGEPILKVKSGLFGLGGSYYIPASAVRDVTPEKVVLSVDKSKLDNMGWDTRPSWIKD